MIVLSCVASSQLIETNPHFVLSLLLLLQEIHCGLKVWRLVEVCLGGRWPWRQHAVLAHGEGGAHHQQHHFQPLLRLPLLQGERGFDMAVTPRYSYPVNLPPLREMFLNHFQRLAL